MVSKAEQAARRRAKVEEQRRQEESRQRRRLVFIIGGAVVTAAIIVLIFVSSTGVFGGGWGGAGPKASQQIVPAAPEGSKTTRQATVTTVPNTTGVSGVRAFDTTGWPGDGSAHAGALQHSHVSGTVTYSVVPPAGGPHNAVWMNAGAYTKPVPTERVVHNLEHGAVWITYRPGLSKSDVAKLTAFVGKQSMIAEKEQGVTGQANRYVDLSPWATNALPSKIVISSWGYQLRVSSPTDPRLQQFVDTFRHNAKYSPEFGAAVDGIPVQTGGRPASDGSRKPNPAGAVD